MSKLASKGEIFELVYDLVSQVPKGQVVTYGDIAKIVGIKPRYVGYILHHNSYPDKVPCHRVVNSQGKMAANFAFGGGFAQERLLQMEGIVFKNHQLNLSLYRYYL